MTYDTYRILFPLVVSIVKLDPVIITPVIRQRIQRLVDLGIVIENLCLIFIWHSPYSFGQSR